MEDIKIVKSPKLKNPYLIVAWPGMGEVAYKATSYLVDKLKAEKFAEILPDAFFYSTGSIISGGILNVAHLPESKFYFWKNPANKRKGFSKESAGKTDNHDLIVFISNAQPDLSKAQEYSRKIIRLAKTFNVEAIVSFASMPQPIDHTQESKVWLATTGTEMMNSLKKHNFQVISEGQISGMNGLFLAIAKSQGLKGFCLLGEIPLYTIQIENPKASYAVLLGLSKILNIHIDFGDIVNQIHNTEGEINKLLDYLKLGAHTSGPIQEEEIEKIKKTLSQFTKTPVSIKEKIEKLFELAEKDLSKANELKDMLDKWNAYKDYEDRFLDLFKKPEDKKN